MIRLINITKNGTIISADYYCENDPLLGHVVYDLEKSSFVSITRTHPDEAVEYAIMRRGLERVSAMNPVPEKYTLMWY